MIALDASALLALLFREQGAEQVATHLSATCLSPVNAVLANLRHP